MKALYSDNACVKVIIRGLKNCLPIQIRTGRVIIFVPRPIPTSIQFVEQSRLFLFATVKIL